MPRVAGIPAALAACTLLILSGCASSDTVDTSESFVQGASPDGLVIMGLKSNKWYGWGYRVLWRRVDPQTKEPSQEPADQITVGRDLFEVFTPDGPSTNKYMVFRAKPGTYALHSSVVEASNVKLIFNAVYRPTIAFSIGSGEILYLGDFTFIVPEQGLIKSPYGTTVHLTGRDDAAAKQALSEYPNVKGEPRFEMLTPFELK
jgi:hypothetical protein